MTGLSSAFCLVAGILGLLSPSASAWRDMAALHWAKPSPNPSQPQLPSPMAWSSESGSVMLDGKKVNIKGVTWFGFQTATRAPHGLWGNTNTSFFLDFLQENDFNALRVPLDLDLMLNDGKHKHVADDPKSSMTSLQLLDYFVQQCALRGMIILLDMHCLDTGGTNMSPVFFNDRFSEADAVAGWSAMAKRFKDQWNVFAADVFNEPFGGTWAEGKPTDMDAFAVKAAAAIDAAGAGHWLIFVEGTAKSPNCTKEFDGIEVACGYGDNLKGVGSHPVLLPGTQSNKVVYSPHTYGPSQHDRPEFTAPNYPRNMPAIWTDHWGYVKNKTGRAVVLGEWGGNGDNGGSQDQWFAELVQYLQVNDLRDNFFWCLNSDSSTGGLLIDWKQPDTAKLALLQQLQPNPTKFSPPPQFELKSE